MVEVMSSICRLVSVRSFNTISVAILMASGDCGFFFIQVKESFFRWLKSLKSACALPPVTQRCLLMGRLDAKYLYLSAFTVIAVLLTKMGV